MTTADSDWGEGYSKVNLEMNEAGTAAVFHGVLNTRVPDDGRTKRSGKISFELWKCIITEHNSVMRYFTSGYTAMSAVKQRRSFGKLRDLEWYHFTDLCAKVRGDGRTYMINVQVQREFDIHWEDLWSYPLYTRGGPYWQDVMVCVR